MAILLFELVSNLHFISSKDLLMSSSSSLHDDLALQLLERCGCQKRRYSCNLLANVDGTPNFHAGLCSNWCRALGIFLRGCLGSTLFCVFYMI